MRTFLVIWFGQMISVVGSAMTHFALALWLFERTGRATSLVLVGVSAGIPRILTSLFAGLIVDRFSRKKLIMISDLVSGVTTMALLALLMRGRLELWHLYLGAFISGPFTALQRLAYDASISLLVPKSHYVRANSMSWLAGYGSDILAPPLAAALYSATGLSGVMVADLVTFLFAVSTVLLLTIPQPAATRNIQREPFSLQRLTRQLAFGFAYIFSRPALRSLLLVFVLFSFFHDLSSGLYTPMILTRSGNSEQVLAAVVATAGVSGVLSSLLTGWWGAPRQRTRIFLLGTISAGLGKTLFSLGRNITAWMPIQFYTSLNFPLKGSAYTAIWREKVEPAAQGRVFAATTILYDIAAYSGYFLAGPLGDLLFEPAMAAGGPLAPSLGWLVGTGPGAGFALLFFLAGLGMIFSGVLGFWLPQVHHLEETVPDGVPI
jgi:DHA3 family macrolide efflux protein-like MFS transporter